MICDAHPKDPEKLNIWHAMPTGKGIIIFLYEFYLTYKNKTKLFGTMLFDVIFTLLLFTMFFLQIYKFNLSLSL